MKAVLSGEITGYRRVDAETVEVNGELRVKPNAVLHLATPRTSIHVLPGCTLCIEAPYGKVLAGLSPWSFKVIWARVTGWARRSFA